MRRSRPDFAWSGVPKGPTSARPVGREPDQTTGAALPGPRPHGGFGERLDRTAQVQHVAALALEAWCPLTMAYLFTRGLRARMDLPMFASKVVDCAIFDANWCISPVLLIPLSAFQVKVRCLARVYARSAPNLLAPCCPAHASSSPTELSQTSLPPTPLGRCCQSTSACRKMCPGKGGLSLQGSLRTPCPIPAGSADSTLTVMVKAIWRGSAASSVRCSFTRSERARPLGPPLIASTAAAPSTSCRGHRGPGSTSTRQSPG